MDGGRRGSGVGLQGSPQQQIEREFDKLESKEMMIGTCETDTKHRRRPSFEEIFSPEKPGQIEELIESPIGSPVDVDFNCPINPTYPDHLNQSMITPTSASASHAKPSFVTNTKLHSRSISIDMAEQHSTSLTSPQNGYDQYTSLEYPTSDEPSTSVLRPFEESFLMGTPTPSTAFSEAPPVDEKTNALLEELSKLQSAVDSTLKRRQRQKESAEEQDTSMYSSSLLRSRSPSPSPSPRGSPGKSGESMSPLPSPDRPPEYFSPDRDSPEEEDESMPAPRKAIVLREHDLDDYKSSSDEESESEGSDEERKVVTGGEVYYDHSPGEVYTIPEEEDEGGSPTGGDLVTSLNKRPGKRMQLWHVWPGGSHDYLDCLGFLHLIAGRKLRVRILRKTIIICVIVPFLSYFVCRVVNFTSSQLYLLHMCVLNNYIFSYTTLPFHVQFSL